MLLRTARWPGRAGPASPARCPGCCAPRRDPGAGRSPRVKAPTASSSRSRFEQEHAQVVVRFGIVGGRARRPAAGGRARRPARPSVARTLPRLRWARAEVGSIASARSNAAAASASWPFSARAVPRLFCAPAESGAAADAWRKCAAASSARFCGQQRVGQVEVQVGIVVAQPQAFAVDANRVVDPALCAQGHAEVVEGGHVVGRRSRGRAGSAPRPRRDGRRREARCRGWSR